MHIGFHGVYIAPANKLCARTYLYMHIKFIESINIKLHKIINILLKTKADKLLLF